MKNKDRSKQPAFKGSWITPDFKYSTCMIETEFGNRYIKKKGFELKSILIYCDHKYRLWVAEPGYLWDGPSYPSDENSVVGKVLKVLVGDRKKKGLLASSAHHDQMGDPSHIIQLNAAKLKKLKLAILDDDLQGFLEKQKITVISMGIRDAARVYRDMLRQWPDKSETVGYLRSFRQFMGLLIFQPWYRLLFTGPKGTTWRKVITK